MERYDNQQNQSGGFGNYPCLFSVLHIEIVGYYQPATKKRLIANRVEEETVGALGSWPKSGSSW